MLCPIRFYLVQNTYDLPKAENILEKQSRQILGTNKLTNIALEFVALRSEAMANQVVEKYAGGKQLVFQSISLERANPWGKDITDITEELHVTRRSLNAIVMLFRYKDQPEDENFIFPNIDEIEVSINGKPNSIFSSGLRREDIYNEARDFFATTENSSLAKFFNDRFCVVLDCRSNKDRGVINSGTKVQGGRGIQIRVKKR